MATWVSLDHRLTVDHGNMRVSLNQRSTQPKTKATWVSLEHRSTIDHGNVSESRPEVNIFSVKRKIEYILGSVSHEVSISTLTSATVVLKQPQSMVNRVGCVSIKLYLKGGRRSNSTHGP